MFVVKAKPNKQINLDNLENVVTNILLHGLFTLLAFLVGLAPALETGVYKPITHKRNLRLSS